MGGVGERPLGTHVYQNSWFQMCIRDRSTVGALLLESEGNANDGGGNIGVGVIELQVALKSGNLVILAGVEPVSYTHLDVYKRQPFLLATAVGRGIIAAGTL